MNTRNGECVNVLVTGGAGFIGRALVHELVAEGHMVGVLDSLVEQVHGPTRAWPADMPATALRWRADVRDRAAVSRALRDMQPHVVVHLAAEVGVGQAEVEPARYVDANVVGTAILLEAIAAHEGRNQPPVERLIVAGSMSAYGEGVWHCPVHGGPMRPPRHDIHLAQQQWDPVCPAHGVDTGQECTGVLEPRPTPEWASLQAQGVYALTKRCQEDLALYHARNTGLSVAVTRFFNVWGPGQAPGNPYTGVAIGFGARARHGVAPVVYEDGRQARDFVHVADVAAALRILVGSPSAKLARRAWASPTHQGVFNVGTGVATQILEVADLACEVLAPHLTPKVRAIARRGDIRLCVADPSRMMDLGWRPIRVVDGLRELYAAMAAAPAPTVDLGDPTADPTASTDRGVFLHAQYLPPPTAAEDYPDAVVVADVNTEANREGEWTPDEPTEPYSDEPRVDLTKPVDPTDPLDERLPWYDAPRATPRPPNPVDPAADTNGEEA